MPRLVIKYIEEKNNTNILVGRLNIAFGKLFESLRRNRIYNGIAYTVFMHPSVYNEEEIDAIRTHVFDGLQHVRKFLHKQEREKYLELRRYLRKVLNLFKAVYLRK